MQILAATDSERVSKALYAVGALVRNSLSGQEQFFAAKGVEVLTEILGRHDSVPVLRKTLNLLHDLADTEADLEV